VETPAKQNLVKHDETKTIQRTGNYQISKRRRGRRTGDGAMSAARIQPERLLQMESQIQRDGCCSFEAIERTGDGKPQIETDVCRPQS